MLLLKRVFADVHTYFDQPGPICANTYTLFILGSPRQSLDIHKVRLYETNRTALTVRVTMCMNLHKTPNPSEFLVFPSAVRPRYDFDVFFRDSDVSEKLFDCNRNSRHFGHLNTVKLAESNLDTLHLPINIDHFWASLLFFVDPDVGAEITRVKYREEDRISTPFRKGT